MNRRKNGQFNKSFSVFSDGFLRKSLPYLAIVAVGFGLASMPYITEYIQDFFK